MGYFQNPYIYLVKISGFKPIFIMLKRLFFLIILFVSFSVLAQKEANIWYFGANAGLDFNSGAPVALTDGQLNTLEGCATISDSNGNLLFYTDGISAWNRNHTFMQNGFGLLGDSSSTHSALIVPNPENSNIYYIFTVDEQATQYGLQYSEVDMTLDNGLGGITSTKNVLLHTPTSEKISAIRNETDNSFWVVSHKWQSDEFISFKITGAGVNTNPVISKTGLNVGTDTANAIGAIKISPNGKKLAVARLFFSLELFDFDAATGEVSNGMVLGTPIEGLEFYGVEFSPNGKYLYTTVLPLGVFQYDILAGTENDIINSKININGARSGALQLAVDGKIYVAHAGTQSLSVINKPNFEGLAADFQEFSVDLNGRRSQFGLPPFIQSFFNVGAFDFANTCFGDTTTFKLGDTVDTILWDFGDPASGTNNTSTDFEPTHVFTNPGTYTITVTATSGGDSATNKQDITIFELPTVTPSVTLKQCDDNLDGYSAFNLEEVIPEISANASEETITFHETLLEANEGTNAIPMVNAYTNEVVSTDKIWARIENNNLCFRISEVNLIVSTTQIPLNFMKDFYECDDDLDGDTENSISEFDFSGVTMEIEGMFPSGQQLIITYYQSQDEALQEVNPISNISTYRNDTSPHTQNIYVRVDSETDNDCLGLGHHITLHVEQQPVAHTVIIPEQCDDDGDMMFAFDTSTIETELLQGQTGMQVIYTDASGNVLPSPLPNPFLTPAQTLSVRVVNATSQDPDGACYDETTLIFDVDEAVVAYPIQDIIECDDDDDLLFPFNTSQVESTLLNGQTGMIVTYRDEKGNSLPSPLPNPFLTSTQTITARIENPLSSRCYDETSFDLVVIEQPVLDMADTWILCEGKSVDLVADPGYDEYIWSTGETESTITVFADGPYEVRATNTYNGVRCETSKTITVIPSNIATITDIEIEDWTQSENVIRIFAEGDGDYEYSVDGTTYQDEPIFTNLEIGDYTVYVRDKNECGIIDQEVFLMYYPKFFTPNNDSYHDTWQIYNSSLEPNNQIYIFDRYGKLLKQLNASGEGWDGSVNGRMMPTGDYWFLVKRQNGRQYRGHFTLKR